MIQLSPLPSARDQEAFHQEDRQSQGIGLDVEAAAIARRKAWDTARRTAWVSSCVPPGARVLDVGSGYGTLLSALAQRGYRMLGLELSSVRTAVSRQLNGVRVIEGDVYRLPAAGGPFDAITFIHVLEHLTRPVEALRALRERLRPGGLLFVEVPNAEDLLLSASPAYRRFYWQRAHVGYFTAATLAEALRRAGWRWMEIQGVQRYGIENLMSWLVQGAPQLAHPSFETQGPYRWLEAAYKAHLEATQRCDTLLAVAVAEEIEPRRST
jgi:2-polyprenyl-3-methyl-5-hydroxy-6-metoxy-1,4-benzoquinol methylase